MGSKFWGFNGESVQSLNLASNVYSKRYVRLRTRARGDAAFGAGLARLCFVSWPAPADDIRLLLR
jgi:hypothetical protein